MGYDAEVELIRLAREKDLLTTPYVFSAADAEKMTAAGADIIVCHMGLTVGGSIGGRTARTLDESVSCIDEWAAAARSVRDDIIVLCTAARSPSPMTRPTCSVKPPTVTASTGPAAWNACQPSGPSPRKQRRSKICPSDSRNHDG